MTSRYHRVAPVSYPHVVRPVPVWIADQTGNSKKTSIASVISTSTHPPSSVPDVDPTFPRASTNNQEQQEDQDAFTTITSLNTHANSNISNGTVSAPPTMAHKGKSVTFSSSNPGYGAIPDDASLGYFSAHPEMIELPSSQESNISPRYPSFHLPSFPAKPQVHQPRIASGATRWTSFVNSTLNAQSLNVGTHRIDEETLNQQADLSGEWGGSWDEETRWSTSSRNRWFGWLFCFSSDRHRLKEARKQDGNKEGNLSHSAAQFTKQFIRDRSREEWKPKLMSILLNNPNVPLALRAINFMLSVIALGLAGAVFVKSHTASPAITQQASTIMALCCQATALVYLVYITYDEYSGKPLGLRDAKGKIRLIMLDLLFIIISSANLSLAFNTLYDPLWICQNGLINSDILSNPLYIPYNATICKRQRGLAAFIFLSLISWIITFTISIFRLVERVSK